MVFTKRIDIESVDTLEILRYMRAGKVPDDALAALVDEVKKTMLGHADCRCCYIKLPIEFKSRNKIAVGDMMLESQKLCEKLKACTDAYVLCATAGVGIDREIQRAQMHSPVRGLAADATGSAIVEAACDAIQEYFRGIEAESGGIIDRFSPGYGGLSLECQRDIMRLLEAKKHIGVSLTDGLMLAPCKSVTAIIGVKRIDKAYD